MRKIGGIALILLVTGRGFARTPSSPADKVAEPVSKTVRGRVLLPDGTSIGGLMVSIGKQGTPTDSNGRFELPNVPETYDLMIAGQGGRVITAYFGLTRRDPIVTHTALGKAPLAKAEHRADIEGIVDMSAMASIRQATEPVAYFLSPSAVAKAAVTEFREVYGRYRFSVGWGGPAVASGILLVLAQGGGQAYLASRRLTIADGQDIHPKFSETEVRADLKLAPVAMGRIAGSTQTLTRKIRLSRSEVEEREALRAAYAVPGMAGVVDLGECEIKQESYVCQAPDLGVLGGQYCIAIVGRADTKLGDYAPGPTRTMDLRASRCGAKLGKTDFQMYRPSPPDIGKGQFNLGPDAEYWTRDTLSWTGRDDLVYQLNLGACAEGSCLVAYLARRAFSWSNLEVTGMTYLRGIPLLASVWGLYPAMSMDALAVSPWRFGAGSTWLRTDSATIEMGLADPPKQASSTKQPKGLGVDPARLPTCSPTLQAHSFADLDSATNDARISVRGMLGLGARTCTLKGCADGHKGRCCINGCGAVWRLYDPGDRNRHIGLRRNWVALDTGVNECDPDPQPVEVIATGTLAARLPKSKTFEWSREEYFLDDVALCAVRSGPPAGK